MAQERREIEITIKVQCNGYAGDVTAQCLVEHIPGLVARLAEHGITPASSPYLWTDQGKDARSNGQDTTGAPVCPQHHVPMKPSKHQSGGWYCSRKLDDGSYCREKVTA